MALKINMRSVRVSHPPSWLPVSPLPQVPIEISNRKVEILVLYWEARNADTQIGEGIAHNTNSKDIVEI